MNTVCIFEAGRRTALRAVTAAAWRLRSRVYAAEVKEQAPGEVIAEHLGMELFHAI